MNLISAEELKAKLDSHDEFKLVMVLGDWAFQLMHIPGSINAHSVKEATEPLSPGDEIVVYCSNIDCVASRAAYGILIANGYENVRRFAGGLNDWQAHGFPLEGTSVEEEPAGEGDPVTAN